MGDIGVGASGGVAFAEMKRVNSKMRREKQESIHIVTAHLIRYAEEMFVGNREGAF